MTNTYKIKCENVSKVYDLNVNRKDKLLSLFTFGLSYKSKPYYALHDISFEVEEGTSVGIIGLNGSGKSTLSNILGGVVEPSSGTVYTNGKPSLIAIGAGLNPEFTGEENIHYKCLMHGMTQREINEKFDDIVQFSELDEFIYQPLKSYSSGMKSRFFVSHSAGQIKKMCKKAIWIHYGEMVAYGEVNDIVARYVNLIQKVKKKSKKEQLEYKRIKIQQQRNKEVDDSVIKKEKRPTSLLAMIGIMSVAWIYILLFQVGIL